MPSNLSLRERVMLEIGDAKMSAAERERLKQVLSEVLDFYEKEREHEDKKWDDNYKDTLRTCGLALDALARLGFPDGVGSEAFEIYTIYAAFKLGKIRPV